MSPVTLLERDAEQLVRSTFEGQGIAVASLDTRQYPEETIFVVTVPQEDVAAAAVVGNQVDQELAKRNFKGFVTVRKIEGARKGKADISQGVRSAVAAELVNLLTARSRTSEAQPSLSYIPDAAHNVSTATAPRHHLIFGRRGAGKTALMLEAKRVVEGEGHLSVWQNCQTLRSETAGRAFLWVALSICDRVQSFYGGRGVSPQVLLNTLRVREQIDQLLANRYADDESARSLLPGLQATLRRFLETTSLRLYLFIDDFHYFQGDQPLLLDMLHGAVRDSNAWLKITAIKHLCRWFQANPPIGLQTGHDADHIDLDVTLEDPSRAKTFLEAVLSSYLPHVGLGSLSRLFATEALDRLVLASGAVPRDYLVLSGRAIREAQSREKAKKVGAQDVNRAAGEAAQVKINELQDDAASLSGTTKPIVDALDRIRSFCLDATRFTFFRVDFQDKEGHPRQYAFMQSLMDLRLIHLLNAGVSDERLAGRRSEVFMLDLSQFSAKRFKKGLRVLDFVGGRLVLKETGTSHLPRVGGDPRRLLGLFRRGPLFSLGNLSGVQLVLNATET